MGKRQYYLEDTLLEAVIKYSTVYAGKIKTTELAKWANENISGLTGVRDYHFTRPVREKDKKTGKTVERIKECKKRIDEINTQRSRDALIGSNLLFKSNPEKIFELTPMEQKRVLVEARALFWQMSSDEAKLKKENVKLKEIISQQNSSIDEIKDRIDEIIQNQSEIKKRLHVYAKTKDEEIRKKTMEEIGIADEMIDINGNIIGVEKEAEVIFNFRNVILDYLDREKSDDETPEEEQERQVKEINNIALERLFGKHE